MPCQCKDASGNYIAKKTNKCVWYIDERMGIVETNERGEQRIATGCYPEVSIRWLGYVAKTVNGAAAAVESNRNVVHDGINAVLAVAAVVGRKQTLLEVEAHEDVKQIAHS